MANNNQNKRVGSFAAINGGVIEGCSANVQLSGCPNGAGFVFGNSGVVKNSVAMRVGRGKGVTGFYKRNTGTINSCGYLADPKKRRIDRSGNVTVATGNPECFMPKGTPSDQLYHKLGLQNLWKNERTKRGFADTEPMRAVWICSPLSKRWRTAALTAMSDPTTAGTSGARTASPATDSTTVRSARATSPVCLKRWREEERSNEKMKLPYQIDLSDKVVAVTGAGGVLMSEFCRALAACGAKVALLDINETAAKAVADEIGENAIAVGTNCLDKASIEAAAERVHQAFGRVNFLINGAGGNNPRATCDNETMTPETDDAVKSFFGLEESGLKFVFDLNITSAFLVTQVFAKDMVQTGGNIINISSMNAFRPLTKIPAYSAAKAGISNFTEWLAVHFAPCGIRVNAIAPGFFVTNQNRALLFDADGNPTARTGKILAATPQKRFGEVSDLIGTLLWLASDDASGFVTGVIVPVDGGFNAYSGV